MVFLQFGEFPAAYPERTAIEVLPPAVETDGEKITPDRF
jgi:hypothetical protein